MLGEVDGYELFSISDSIMTLEKAEDKHDARHNVIVDFVKAKYGKGEVASVLERTKSVVDRIDKNGIKLSMQTAVIKRIRAADEGIYEIVVGVKPPLRFLCFIPDEKDQLVIILGFIGHKNKRPDEIAKTSKEKFEAAKNCLSTK